jgi:hypothetical protein
MTRLRVVQAWQASYDNPVRVSAGEDLRLAGRTDLWDGHLWQWAVDQTGREGWVPDVLIRVEDGHSRAAFDYCAKELTCEAGQVLTALTSLNGWIWCRSEDGMEGWVSERLLQPL